MAAAAGRQLGAATGAEEGSNKALLVEITPKAERKGLFYFSFPTLGGPHTHNRHDR